MGKESYNIKKTYASNMALRKAKELGLRLTSGYRSPALDKKVGGTGRGDHVDGEAYDFAGNFSDMEKLAEWAHRSGMFTQVIFKNKDYRSGRYIPAHMDHVHIAWDGSKSTYGPPEPPLLQNGDKAGLIETVQRLIGNLKIDGLYGPNTEKAVKEFQKEHDLIIDGITGPKTWNELTKGGTGFFS